jgi:hypothetical protein
VNVEVRGTTGYEVNLPGITSSWTRNLLEKGLFHWEL